MAFVNPTPAPSDLALLYPDDYYAFQSPSLPHWLKRAIKKVVGLSRYTYLPRFEKPGVMLDVGCGAGQYLLEMQARGWKVFGSELSRSAAEAGRRAGLDIRGGEIFEAGFASESFDFVRLNHSFEHMSNPHAILAELRRVLKSDGKLFIGVPNSRWSHGAYSSGGTGGTCASRSTRLPTIRRTCAYCCSLRDSTVEKVRYSSDYGGVLGSLQIYRNRNLVPRSSDGAIVRSKLLRLPAQYLARLLDLLRQGDCIEVIATKSPMGPR